MNHRPRKKIGPYIASLGAIFLSISGEFMAFGAEFQFGITIASADPLIVGINQAEVQRPAAAKTTPNGPAPAAKPATGEVNAYLWVPPESRTLRGVILCPANIIERRIAEDPIIRAQAKRDDLGIVFFNATWSSSTLVTLMESVLERLADKSGYDELKTVPWIPVGHSGNSMFAGSLSRLKPQRTLATIIIKGNGFHAVGKDASKPPETAPDNVTTVPLLWISGEFEEVGESQHRRNGWWLTNRANFAAIRRLAPQATAALICDRGHGHIDWMDGISTFTALFIHQAVAARCGDGPALKPLEYAKGWLVDPYGTVPPAPVGAYQGDPALAGWLINEELARAWTGIMQKNEGKREQLLGFTGDASLDGPFADWWNGWALQAIEFKPLEDGVTFRVAARFHEKVPLPFADAGTPLGHGDPALITYQVTGWAGNTMQVGPDAFRVAFDREGVNGRTTHIVLAARHPGDATYRETVAMIRLQIPPGNKEGTPQKILFRLYRNHSGNNQVVRKLHSWLTKNS